MNPKLLKIVAELKGVPPISAAIVFVLSYAAFWMGPAAVAIVLAFLIGLHFAKRPIVAEVHSVATSIAPPVVQSVSGLGDAIAAGLQIRKIEFITPTNGRSKQVAKP